MRHGPPETPGINHKRQHSATDESLDNVAGMASPAITPSINIEASINDADAESDYGSDFSPEQELLVEALLLQQEATVTDDNPIINDIEDEPRQALRLPRVAGREQQMSPLFQAARAAEEVAEQISRSIKTREYPDCKRPNAPRHV